MRRKRRKKKGPRIVTVDEIRKDDQERDYTETFLEHYDGWVRHRKRVPASVILVFQKRFVNGNKKDLIGYNAALLAYLMVDPKVSETEALELLEADGVAMMGIIGPAMGEI